MKILSIIIPVYNSETTLIRCVRSVETQDISHSDYEVILVNDGSTDNSLPLIHELNEEYDNILIVDKQNGGQSSARNAGMKIASGKYFMFVDSDDYLEPNSVGNLVKVCEDNNLDLCRFHLSRKYPGEDAIKAYSPEKELGKIYTGKKLLHNIMAIGSACSSVYRADMLKNNRLEFHVGITHEDVEFTTRVFCHVNRSMIVNDIVYFYVMHSDSMTHSRSYEAMDKNLCDSAIVAALSKKYAKEHVADKETADLICRIENSGIGGTMINLLRLHDYPKSIVKHFIETAKRYKVYPIKGEFLNRRMKLASLLLNCEHVFLAIYNIRRKGSD